MGPFSPGADCCCCPELDDFCTACGAEIEAASRYEVIVQGMRNCDPPTSQSCDDCEAYDGTYILDYVNTFGTGLSRTCLYRYLLDERCNDGGGPITALQKIELQVIYGRITERDCLTALEVQIAAAELPVTQKGRWRYQTAGLLACQAIDGLTLTRHQNSFPCSPNTACDWLDATATVSWLP